MRNKFKEPRSVHFKIALFAFSSLTFLVHMLFQAVYADEFYAPPEREGTRSFSLEKPSLESLAKAQIHDYIGNHGFPGLSSDYKTSGRYMAFAIPMKWWHLSGLFDDDPVIRFFLLGSWTKGEGDGQGRLTPWHDGGIRSQRESLSHPSAVRITVRAHAASTLIRDQATLVAAREAGVQTPTFRPGGRRDIFWLGETYCGFDVFEIGEPRRWNDERGAPAEEPHPDIPTRFHTGRVFGYPAGQPDYAFVAECSKVAGDKVQCVSSSPLNDFVDFDVGMDARNLCDVPEIRAQAKKMILDHATLIERE